MKRLTAPLMLLVLCLTASLLTACGRGQNGPDPLFSQGASTAPTPSGAPAGSQAPSAATTTPPNATTATPTSAKKTGLDDIQGDVKWSHQVMIVGDRIMEPFGKSDSGIQHYTQNINALASKIPANIRVVAMVSPTSGEFYTPTKYRKIQNSQREAINLIYKELAPRIIKADDYDVLLQHTNEYIYFRTDHHWTGLGAYYGYTALMNALQIKPVPLSDYEEHPLKGSYLGSLYRFAKENPAVKNNPDTVTIYKPKTYKATGWVYNDFTLSGGYAMPLLNTEFGGEEKYLAFSGGDAAVLKIASECGTGKVAVVIKDSYANALVPHLANHYSEVYVVDPRQAKGDLIAFIKKVNANDVMVMNYAFAYSNPSWNDGLKALYAGS